MQVRNQRLQDNQVRIDPDVGRVQQENRLQSGQSVRPNPNPNPNQPSRSTGNDNQNRKQRRLENPDPLKNNDRDNHRDNDRNNRRDNDRDNRRYNDRDNRRDNGQNYDQNQRNRSNGGIRNRNQPYGREAKTADNRDVVYRLPDSESKKAIPKFYGKVDEDVDGRFFSLERYFKNIILIRMKG